MTDVPPYDPASDFTTSKGNIVEHLHLRSGDYSAAEKVNLANQVQNDFPSVIIIDEATWVYNCHDFAHAPNHLAWFNEVDQFMNDDYDQMTPASLQQGDVVVYVASDPKDGEVKTHSAVVTGVAGNTITELASKWGSWPKVKHSPTTVPSIYGVIKYYLRRSSSQMTAADISKRKSKIRSLLNSLNRKGQQIVAVSSSPAAARVGIAQQPEMVELRKSAALAGSVATELLQKAKSNLNAIVLMVVLDQLSFTPALQTVAKRIVKAPKIGKGYTLYHAVLSKTFQSLSHVGKSETEQFSEAAAGALKILKRTLRGNRSAKAKRGQKGSKRKTK